MKHQLSAADMSSRMRRICVTLLCLCHPVFLAMAAEGRPLVGLLQMSDRTGVPFMAFNIGLQLRCLVIRPTQQVIISRNKAVCNTHNSFLNRNRKHRKTSRMTTDPIKNFSLPFPPPHSLIRAKFSHGRLNLRCALPC